MTELPSEVSASLLTGAETESWDGSEGETKQCERDGEVGEECWVKNNTATVGRNIP